MGKDTKLRPSFLCNLPIELLLLWSTFHFLNLDCNSTILDVSLLKRLSLDVIIQVLARANSSFCSHLACRFCLRTFTPSRFPALTSVLDYIKDWLKFVVNDGAVTHTGISNDFVWPKIFIPSPEAVFQAIVLKGAIPCFVPSTRPTVTFSTSIQTQVTTRADLRGGGHPGPTSQQGGGGVPPSLERLSSLGSNVETCFSSSSVPRTSDCLSQEPTSTPATQSTCSPEPPGEPNFYNPFHTYSTTEAKTACSNFTSTPSWLTTVVGLQLTPCSNSCTSSTVTSAFTTNTTVTSTFTTSSSFLATPPGLSIKRQRDPDGF